jgi:hypothetical protein
VIPPRRKPLRQLFAPSDATETERQGQGIGDIEAMRQAMTVPAKAAWQATQDAGTQQREAFGRMLSGAATEDDMSGMASDFMLPMAGSLENVAAKAAKPSIKAATDALIKTWHASKSDIPFTKFLREYFGTGSGGDRLGPAVYTTTARQESEEYLKNVAANRAAEAVLESGRRVPIPYEIATQLKNQEVPLEDIVSGAEKRLLSLQDIASKKKGASWSGSKTEKDIRAQSDLLSTLQGILSGGIQEIKRPGTLYEVGLDVSPEQLLNFDKDLIDQTPFVQDAIKSAMGIGPNPRSPKDVVAYRNMLNKGLRTPDVAKRLEDAGIQGVIARPAVSFPGSKTMNYATFNPDRANITRVMGILGMLTGAGAAGNASQKDNRKKPQGS